MLRGPKLLLLAGVLLAAAFLFLRGMGWFSKPPVALGAPKGILASCPNRPNCVCSQAASTEHGIDPLAFTGPADQAWQRLQDLLQQTPRARQIDKQPTYLRYEFRTLLMGYVDDVEFVLDEENSVIHFRSASRLGYSDLGTNRRRMEQIRARFQSDPEG